MDIGKVLASKAAGKGLEVEIEPESDDMGEGGDALDECCAALAPDMERGEARSLLKSAILQVLNEK